MTDEQSTPTGQEPEPTPAPQDDATRTPEQYEAEIRKLRDESAKRRTQLREAQTQIDELTPLAEQYGKMQEAQKSDAERAQERIAELEATIAQKDAQAASMAAEAKLMRLAQQAGVDAELVPLIDTSKLDLDDDEATIATLSKLAAPAKAPATSNSGRTTTDPQNEAEQWYKAFRNRTTTMFDGG